jgi:hypothetical protein
MHQLVQGHSVFQRNPDKAQGRRRLGRAMAAGRRKVGVAYPAHQPHDSVAQRRHDLRDIATPHLRAILIKGHIPDPMRLVLDVPLAADQGQPPGRVGPLWGEARDASHHFLAHRPSLFDDDLPLQPKHLRQPWPVTVAPQHVTGAPPALLDAAMSQVQGFCHRAPLSRPRRQGKHGLNIVSQLGWFSWTTMT